VEPEEWKQVSNLDFETPIPEGLLEKYGWRKWYCARCRLTIEDEHKVIAPRR